MTTTRISPLGPFSLECAARFLCGFTPLRSASRSTENALTLAFLDEVTFEPTVVDVSECGDDVLVVGRAGARDPSRQVARILSLDHDATALAQVIARDPVVAALFTKTPRFRPVCFASPYEAAIWGVLSQRTAMSVAATNRERLARALGGSVQVDGITFDASPRPFALLGTKTFPGISEEKLARLHAVAKAALEGHLEVDTLRSDPQSALSSLSKIRGIGPWTAEHVLVRGAGTVDELPASEPRVLRAIEEAYGRSALTQEDVQRIAESWRPYRTWVSVRMVTALSSAGGRAPRRVERRTLLPVDA